MANIDNDGELIWSVDDLHDFLKRAKESGKKKESLLHDKLLILQSNYDELVKNMKKFPIEILDFGYDVHIKDNLSILKEILEKGRIIYEKSSDIERIKNLDEN